ncbi:single-stranded DNA-binding protein [Lachnoclostridium pacaense]|uniref:single-stranded DNA-binding protein n=1 Tax=Enterocloster hominis (ex Hitch et al. 2024) TaxID=1917870 RepID=UPI001D1253B3|nr:single-stranded DNA-binding protein [Lachnoclostridium pacaense]MCC2817218.1 single-stranded DNA-binding protein [Lachnoclostridium pacaense]
MNKCIFLGRMTDDPEISYTQGETAMAIARFDFAVDRRGAREGEPTADFFRCTAFDRKAELLERFGRKGLKLLLTGKMQNNNYTNREGVKVYSMQYVVDDLEFAESKKNSSEDGSVQEAPLANQPSQSAQPSQAAQSRQPAQQSRAAQPNQASSRQPSRQPARQAARPAPRGTRQNAPASNKDDFMNIDAGDLPFN